MLKQNDEIPKIHNNKTSNLKIFELCTTKPNDITDEMRNVIKDLNDCAIDLYGKVEDLKRSRKTIE